MSLLRHLTVDITPLRISRDYRLLFAGQLISFFGSMMTFVVIPVQMYQITESNFAVGMIYAVEFIPMIILSFIGGALADAVDRRMMLRVTEVGQTVVTAILLANAFLPSPMIWVLYVPGSFGHLFTGTGYLVTQKTSFMGVQTVSCLFSFCKHQFSYVLINPVL